VGCVTKAKLAFVLLTHETVIQQALYHEYVINFSVRIANELWVSKTARVAPTP
jgi:hypothetical protein